MTHHSDQQQHDRTDEQYGRQPASTETGAGTSQQPPQQPRFGGSTQQYGATDQRTGGHLMSGQQMGGHQMSGRQTGGQQLGGQGTGTRPTSRAAGQRMQRSSGTMQPHSFDDHMTDELWIALEDFGELAHVAAWCASQCATGDPELGTCARVCQDLAEIAAVNEMLIARDSTFGPEMAEAFMRIAAEGVQTLRQYQQRHPPVRETAATIERTMNSCEALLGQVGEGSGSASQQASREPQGMPEQGQYGQGMSGQPRGGSAMTGQRY